MHKRKSDADAIHPMPSHETFLMHENVKRRKKKKKKKEK
jgi:hypothetical protein